MPLLRVPRQFFGALVDHLDGRRGRLCLRGPPESLILLVHRRPLQSWRDRDRQQEDCRESTWHARLSPSSPCATRRHRGDQTPLRLLGSSRVSQPQRNCWHSAARLLAREPNSEERPAVPGCTAPARSDRLLSALVSRIRSRQDFVRRAADLGRKAMTSPPSVRKSYPWDSPKVQKHTRVGFSLSAVTDPVAAGPAMRPGSFYQEGGRRVQD